MNGVEIGMLAKSLAGHDKDNIYYIEGFDSQYIYLVDGRLRKSGNPKKKKGKHIQIIKYFPDNNIYNIESINIEETRNICIRNVIKQYESQYHI